MSSNPTRLALLLMLLASTPISTLAPANDSPDERQPPRPMPERMKTALKNVDRLTVTPPVNDLQTLAPGKKILFEMRGNERIATLANTIAFVPDENEWRVPCLCFGTHDLFFYCGDNVKFRINYKHFSRLGGVGENSPFAGEYDMTDDSAAAFADWFAKNGYPDFQNAIAGQKQALLASQEQARRVAALFPENARAIIPEYQVTPEPWTREKTRATQAAETMARAQNKNEILRACWLAIGDEYDAPYYAQSEVRGIEPPATIYALLHAAPDADLNNALMTAPADDNALLRGAFVSLCAGGDSIRKKFSDAALAKIFAHMWTHPSEKSKKYEWMLPAEISHANGPECMALRLKIARSGQPTPVPYEPPTIEKDDGNGLVVTSYQALSPWLEVLLDLSMQQVPEARRIVLEKLENAPEGLDKLALEIALACYDGPAKLQEKHFAMQQPELERALDKLRPSRGKAVGK